MSGTNAGRLAAFDLDGTLVNTLDDLAAAANVALIQFGFPVHEVEEYRGFVGNGISRLIERALPPEHRDEAARAAVRAAFDTYYEAHCLDRSRPYEGVLAALDELRGAGLTLAVVSNKAHPYTCRIVESLFGDRFTAVLGHREGAPHKPDPAPLLEVMRQTGAPREAAVYIGDSDVDMLTGRSAGVATIGCTWGFRGERELCMAGAMRIARRPSDWPGLISWM